MNMVYGDSINKLSENSNESAKMKRSSDEVTKETTSKRKKKEKSEPNMVDKRQSKHPVDSVRSRYRNPFYKNTSVQPPETVVSSKHLNAQVIRFPI